MSKKFTEFTTGTDGYQVTEFNIASGRPNERSEKVNAVLDINLVIRYCAMMDEIHVKRVRRRGESLFALAYQKTYNHIVIYTAILRHYGMHGTSKKFNVSKAQERYGLSRATIHNVLSDGRNDGILDNLNRPTESFINGYAKTVLATQELPETKLMARTWTQKILRTETPDNTELSEAASAFYGVKKIDK
tara:strand:- start:3908 stop:4477 length:570 start_codon:yes stop_codon:yes gene_type:complete